MRKRLLRVSGLLAAVLLLQWAVGLAGCVASLQVQAGPDLFVCHADGAATSPPSGAPTEHGLDRAACPLCLQLAATVLPEPPSAASSPPLAHAVAVPPHASRGWTPARTNPAHPARGPPAFS